MSAGGGAGRGVDFISDQLSTTAKDHEVVAQKRDTDVAMTDRALKIVREFIVERQLILYGGQAIDYSLRLKGSGIYPEHQTPDFDFFSPRSVDDAYDLAERFNKEGFLIKGKIITSIGANL